VKHLLENISTRDLQQFHQTFSDFKASLENPNDPTLDILNELSEVADEISWDRFMKNPDSFKSVTSLVETVQEQKYNLLNRLNREKFDENTKNLLTKHVLQFYDSLTLELVRKAEDARHSGNYNQKIHHSLNTNQIDDPIFNIQKHTLLQEENNRLKEIYALSLELASHNTSARIYEFIAARLQSIVPYEALIILDASNDKLFEYIFPAKQITKKDIEFGQNKIEELFELFDRTIINRAAILTKVYDEKYITDDKSHILNPEIVFLPMIENDRTWGILGALRDSGNPFNPAEVHSLSIVTSLIDLVERNINAMDHQHHLRRSMMEQINFAKTVQRRVLPTELRTDKMIIQTHFQPSESISGDFYKFFNSDKNSYGVIIGDVTGHGLAAGLMMMTVMGILTEALTLKDVNLAEMFRKANQNLTEIVNSEFLLTSLAVWFSDEGKLQYFNAGHPPGLLYRMQSHELVELSSTCFPMGIFLDLDLNVNEITVDEDFRILLYTDGLIEARNRNRKQFGLEKVKDLFSQTANLNCSQALETILSAVNAHSETISLKDDLALVIIEKRL
jgi:serine phosphatase RsbU (regulator of sigma subunit)